MIKITTPGAVHPVAVEYDAGDDKCRIDLTDGEGYLSPDGKQWERAEEDPGVQFVLEGLYIVTVQPCIFLPAYSGQEALGVCLMWIWSEKFL